MKISFSFLLACQSSQQQLQCYECGLPKVHPNNDIAGSYCDAPGKRLYDEDFVFVLLNF